MKLINKKTGEIPDKIETIAYIQWCKKIMMVYINRDGERIMKHYDSLEAFNEEWEDVKEEPNRYYLIDLNGEVSPEDVKYKHKGLEEVGLTFETREEAEKAVEKLKAWKRLKDKGFEFEYVGEYENLCGNGFEIPITAIIPPEAYTDVEVRKDLDLLFSGEDD